MKPGSGQPRAQQDTEGAFRTQRRREAGLILPFFGLVLVAPPLVNLFISDITIFGAPLIGVYLYSVWAVLIGGSFWLSRKLQEDTRG
jgi:hypothetical protein